MLASGPHERFPRLFEPISIRSATLRNRVAVSGHFAGWWVAEAGLPSDAFVAYLEERARGGVGLFVIGATSPMPGSGWMENVSDAIIPHYRKLAEAGRRHGAKVFAQLCHPGFRPLPPPSIYKWIPSAPSSAREELPQRHVPSVQELQELVAAFGAAARRAAEGGVDGVEIHSHESFLHAQMLNPAWNQRTDEYGGSLDNRTRFLRETLDAVRKAIPAHMPLGVRLKADDLEQRGMDATDYALVVRKLEAQKLVDYVNFTGGDGRLHHGPTPRPEGEWIELVARLKQQTGLVVMHAGRITTPDMAERALSSGAMDVVVMTKTHICDPHFTRKVWSNRTAEIRYCTRCLRCHGKMDRMACIYNPLTSRELEWSAPLPATRNRRVVIAGAGPAGMEAAIRAADRGHEVIVLERTGRIGGQIHAAAASSMRAPMLRIAEFYQRQAESGRFRVMTETEATRESILELNPDVVIVATGSRPERVDVPGASGRPVLTVHEVVAGAADAARRAAIVDREGGARALVAADRLSAQGIMVEFVTPLRQVTPEIELMVTDEFVDRLSGRGVRFSPGLEIEVWLPDGSLRLRSAGRGDAKLVENVDCIVGAVGSTSCAELVGNLVGSGIELHVIGDARQPRTCEEATVEGAAVARCL